MANFSVDKKLIEPYLPNKTEIDIWNNLCYISLVGFMFVNTKIKGIKIPFHTNFEEVNLRFYVRYKEDSNWKRGVVFIKEIVPKLALTAVANTIYKENYETMPMSHNWKIENEKLMVEYRWKKDKWNSFLVKTDNKLTKILVGSEEEFITEHYWGYTRINGNKTSEYGVEHPRWDVYKTIKYSLDVDFGNIYGDEFKFLNSEKPVSVFLAEGSDILVKSGKVI